jgi:site-specific DNA recombinase
LLTERIERDPLAACSFLSALLHRIVLHATTVEISLHIDALVSEGGQAAKLPPLTVTRLIPVRLRRRGVELRVISAHVDSQAHPTDPALLKAVARGHRWFRELASGTAADTLAIAKREEVPDNHVRRLIPLAFLSPALVEAICAGRQPVTLTAEKLKRTAHLPSEWSKQQELFASF